MSCWASCRIEKGDGGRLISCSFVREAALLGCLSRLSWLCLDTCWDPTSSLLGRLPIESALPKEPDLPSDPALQFLHNAPGGSGACWGCRQPGQWTSCNEWCETPFGKDAAGVQGWWPSYSLSLTPLARGMLPACASMLCLAGAEPAHSMACGLSTCWKPFVVPCMPCVLMTASRSGGGLSGILSRLKDMSWLLEVVDTGSSSEAARLMRLSWWDAGTKGGL